MLEFKWVHIKKRKFPFKPIARAGHTGACNVAAIVERILIRFIRLHSRQQNLLHWRHDYRYKSYRWSAVLRWRYSFFVFVLLTSRILECPLSNHTPEKLEWENLSYRLEGAPIPKIARHHSDRLSDNRIICFGGSDGANYHGLFVLDIGTINQSIYLIWSSSHTTSANTSVAIALC